MKVVTNDHNNPLTLAEMAACRQFEASNWDGQALFHPQVAAGQPAPKCVASFEEVGRFAVTVMEGPHSVANGQWFRHDADGARTPIDNPLEKAWQAGRAVRARLHCELELNTYVIAVAWFPDMDEDEDILEEVGGRSVRLFFGQVDLVERLVNLPKENELQTQLNGRYIEREVAVLSRAPDVERPAGEVPPSVAVRDGALVLERVDTVNVYITVVNGGVGDDPPLITLPGQ